MQFDSKTNLLILGSGPFGLSLSALASHLGIEHLVVGQPMEFWHKHMPKGMYLRSACDWHLDPLNVHTIEAFALVQGKTNSDVEPLSLQFYQSYAEWFQQQKGIIPLRHKIEKLDHSSTDNGFVATTDKGATILASNVVLAPGFRHFAMVPEELMGLLPAARFSHTCDYVDFGPARGRRYLIIGGRQSAFEWAALLLEAGAGAVHVSHRPFQTPHASSVVEFQFRPNLRTTQKPLKTPQTLVSWSFNFSLRRGLSSAFCVVY